MGIDLPDKPDSEEAALDPLCISKGVEDLTAPPPNTEELNDLIEAPSVMESSLLCVFILLTFALKRIRSRAI